MCSWEKPWGVTGVCSPCSPLFSSLIASIRVQLKAIGGKLLFFKTFLYDIDMNVSHRGAHAPKTPSWCPVNLQASQSQLTKHRVPLNYSKEIPPPPPSHNQLLKYWSWQQHFTFISRSFFLGTSVRRSNGWRLGGRLLVLFYFQCIVFSLIFVFIIISIILFLIYSSK